MKPLKIIAGLFILLILTASANYAQQQFVHTVTSLNKNCNSACSIMNIPALNNNPLAIIIVTPIVVNGASPNQPQFGVYYDKQWSVYNTNGQTIADGLTFNIQYWATPTANQFSYIIPPIGTTPCLNHAALNGNSRAQLLYSPTVSPRGQYYNKDEIEIKYNVGVSKWCLANLTGQPMRSDSAYNIVIASVGVNTTDLTRLPDQNTKTPIGGVTDPACNCPTSLPPNGNAGGDLSGTYPNPTVQKLLGRPISTNIPKIGQILKWNGTEWIPVEDDVAASPPVKDNAATSSPDPKPSVLYFHGLGYFYMDDPNVDTKPIDGLNNQFFTLTKSSRVVFHTSLSVSNTNPNVLDQIPYVWLTTEILNPSGEVVARSTNAIVIPRDGLHYPIQAVGIGVLPVGTYHTRVTINRDKGTRYFGVYPGVNLSGFNSKHESLPGQLIIEIFPD